MLATSGRPAGDLTGWAAEPKLDGWPAAVAVDGDDLVVRSRRGRHLTDCVPELHGIADGTRRLVLDGELIVGAGRLADFSKLSGRLAGKPRKDSPAVVFVAFDLLWNDGDLLTDEPYQERRARLLSLDLGPVQVAPAYPGEDADALLAGCEREGMKGIVLERLTSVYRPGQRTKDWAKVKCPAWRDHLDLRRPRR